MAPSTQENTSTDSGGRLSSGEHFKKEEAREERGDNDCVGTSAATAAVEGPPPLTGEAVSGWTLNRESKERERGVGVGKEGGERRELGEGGEGKGGGGGERTHSVCSIES